MDEAIGRGADRLHAVHYDRARRPLSLADCITLATALAHDVALATSALRPMLLGCTRKCRGERAPYRLLPD